MGPFSFGAQNVIELGLDLSHGRRIVIALKMALKCGEFPVQDALLMPTATGRLAIVEIFSLKARCLEFRRSCFTKQSFFAKRLIDSACRAS